MNLSLTVLVALFLTVLPVAAQEDSAATAARPPGAPAEELMAALDGLFATPKLRFEGRIAATEPDAGGPAMGVVVVGGASAGKEFSGKIEVLREGDALLVVSKDRLPGVAIYDDGETRITRVTCADDEIGCKLAANDLASVFSKKRLRKAVLGGGWQATVDPKTGATTFKAKLKGNLIRTPAGGMPGMGFMQARVRRVDALITLDARKQVTDLSFEVIRSDPMAAMRRRAFAGELDGGPMTPEDLEADAEDEEDGGGQIYTLRVSAGPPSARAAAVLKDLAGAASEGGF